MTTTVELIAQRLVRAGVKSAYGIPGGEVLTLIKALDGAGIEFVMSKHENAAGFMAEGSYHASGAPGVLVATVGPGVANAINFIVNAQQERVPIIYLTGCVDASEAATYTHQVFDHQALLRPITKASFRITEAAVEEIIDKAIAIAMDDPPGPVHLDLPISLAAAQQSRRQVKDRAKINRGVASGADFAIAQQLFANARSPLIVAGVEVLYQGAQQQVAQVCHQYNLPIITSYKGKGIISEDHPLALGGAGLSPKANQLLMPFMQQADLIILVGYDPIEMRSDWRNPWNENIKIIELCAQPNTHYMHQADFSFVADIGPSLIALAKHRPNDSPCWEEQQLVQIKNKLSAAFADDDQWGPAQLIASCRQLMPRNTVATVDTGAHRILLSQIWHCYSANTLLQSSALCTMGCALPLAIGYKKANPQVPVIAFSGDAGLEMVLGDLATLRDLKLAITLVVFVDDSLALIEMKQRAMGYENLGVDSAGSTDFVSIAQAFNLTAHWIYDDLQLRQALDTALHSQQATVLACRISRHSYDGKI
ncbi:MAG: acetolactate synthase AlsS [Osedax symbiont Rs2]|nr:MAG: acetolactate synthase AlsS [Osedax symbiont Rs2]